MTRRLLFVAFVLTMALTLVAAHHQLTNAAPNMAPPPKHAPPIEQYPTRLDPQTMVPPGPTWHVIAGGGGKDAHLYDVGMVSPDEGWAVGVTGPTSYGVVMHYTNTVWSRVAVPTGTYAINAVAMVSPTEGWAVGSIPCMVPCGETGLILHYTANTGWQRVTLPAKPDGGYWYGFSSIDIKGVTGWIVGYNNYFLKFNGSGWTPVAAPSISARDVSIVNDNEAWAVGYLSQMAHFSGGSWSSTTPWGAPSYSDLKAIHMLNASDGWAVGYIYYPSYQSLMFHYDGSHWTQVPCPGNSQLSSVYMRNSNDVWAVGSKGTILHYDGSNWSQLTSLAGSYALSSVKLIGTNDGYIVGNDGLVLRLVNGNWTQVQGPRLTVGPLDSVSTNEVWWGGNTGELYRWKDGATTAYSSPVTKSISALDMISPTLGWAVTGFGSGNKHVLKYSDGEWAVITSTNRYIYAVSMVGPDEGWFGTSGSLLHYNSGGWQSESVLQVSSLSMLDPSYGWATNYSSQPVYTYTNGTWNQITPTLTITDSDISVKVISVSPDEAWVAGWSDTWTAVGAFVSPQLHHFSDGTWTSIPTPDWLAFHDISKVSATEWWAVGKLTTLEYAFLHYKDGTYTVVATSEDVQGISMLPDGTGFARGVGSLLWLHEYPYSVFLPVVVKQ